MTAYSKHIKVLIAEDDKADRLFLTRAIKEINAPLDLHFVYNGEEAINYLKMCIGHNSDKILPRLLILDINMPKKNGIEALTELRSIKEFEFLPVIMYSTSSLTKDIEDSYDNKANSYIKKPDNYQEVIRVIKMIYKFWFETASIPKEQFKSKSYL